MKKRSLIVPVIAILLAVVFSLTYVYLLSPYGITRAEQGTGGSLRPSAAAFRLLRFQLKIVPAEYKEVYYEHLLKVYYRPNTQFDYVNQTDAVAMFEAYFAYKQQTSADTESAEQYTTLSPFRLKDFYDDGGNLHAIRSDDDLFMMYFQSLYANGDREHAKQAYTEHFHLTDNHMTYRYFLTYLLRDKNTPAEDRLWAEEQASALIRVIREEEAAYLENPALSPDSPYQIHGHAQIAVQDLEMCLA